MKEEIKVEIDRRLKELNLPRSINKAWFYNFFELLTDFNFHTENITELLEIVFNEENLKNFDESLIDGYSLKTKNRQYDNSKFFEYLKTKIVESGQDPQEYISEMLKFIKDDSKNNVPFVDAMIKYVMLRHSEDLKIDRGSIEEFENKECLHSSVKIAGLTLCNLYFERLDEKDIIAIDLRTAKGLRGTRLGTLLIDDMFRFAKERNAEARVIGFNVVVANTTAQKMYEKFGGKFFKTENDLQNNSFLTAKEYSQVTEYQTGGVLFDNNVVTQHASKEKPKPYTLQEYLEKCNFQLKNQKKEKQQNK